MAPLKVEQIVGEYNGNGCCCTPSCCKVKIDKHMCCAGSDCFICVRPAICGCGPYCPIFCPCNMTYYRCPILGENVFGLLPYGDCQKFSDDGSKFGPCCCACGMGYVKKAGGPLDNEEMER